MKRTLVILAIVVISAGTLLLAGRTQSSAVKACRADARRFAQESLSYEAEYDSLYGATTLAQRPIGELMDRDSRLMECMSTDSGNQPEYKAVLYRSGFIQANRFLKYMTDTQQLRDFAQWEKRQQQVQLAGYRTAEQR
jgi:hypothetical protein